MPELIATTKPMRSQAQWKFLFATSKPFARRWAKATPGGKVKRYRKLPNKVKKKEARLLTLLKANYGAKKGQVIQGRLVRGEGGRFASSGGGAAKPQASSTSGRRPKRPPPKTEEQRAAERQAKQDARAQERAAKQEENITKTFSAIDLPEDAADSLRRLAAGEPVDDDGGLVKIGLAEQAQDGSYRLTAAGRAVMNAAERGDLGAAKDAKSRAQDKAQAAADAAAKKKLEEKPAGGGGGGKKKEPPVKLAPRQTSQTAKPVGGGGGSGGAPKKPQSPGQDAPVVAAHLADLARRVSAGEFVAEQDARVLIKNGLARQIKGELILTAAGLRATQKEAPLIALLKAQRTYGGKTRTTLPDSAFAGPDRSFPIMTAQDVRDAVRSLGRTKHDKAAVKRGIIRRARAIGATDALPTSWRERSAAPSFTVYKSANGPLRWIARTTTAYRDRDREILPIATLDADSQRMTATKQYGPLRWWHVGRPNALDAAAPWGAGLDLGTCDFSMQIGRTRVESGTFKDAAIAARVAATASHYELSPGFFHAAHEPDPSGVFHAIHTFERSLVPIRHGRASNLFTGLTTTKEHSAMDAAEQARRLKAAIDELGLSPEQAAALSSGLIATDKAAATTPDPATGQPGVAFKSEDAPPAGLMDTLRRLLGASEEPAVTTTKTAVVTPEDVPPATPAVDPNNALLAAMTDLTATLKAAMEAPVELAEEEEVVEEAPIAEPETSSQTIADLSVEEFVNLIGQALSQALAGAMGGISDKVAALDGEMKAMGYTRVKEEQAAKEKADAIAALKSQIDQQQALLAELVSDQPAIPPVRPSQDPANVLHGLKDADPSAPAFAFDDIAAQLFGRQPTH